MDLMVGLEFACYTKRALHATITWTRPHYRANVIIMSNRKGDRALCLALGICAASAYALTQMGCSAAGADGPPFQIVDAPSSPSTATPDGFWFSEDSPLYAAQKAWGKAAPSEPLFQVLPEEEVNAACNNHDASIPPPSEEKRTITLGCTTFLETPVRILVTEGLNTPVTAATKLHELGHFLFGKLNHIQSVKCSVHNTQSAYVMCAAGAPWSEPTPQDFDWALSLPLDETP